MRGIGGAKRRGAFAIAAATALLGVPVLGLGSPAGAQGGCGGGGAAEVICLINQERANAGRPALSQNGALTQAATSHASDMARRNYFSSTSPAGTTVFQRANRAGYPANTAVEELIYWRRGEGATPASAAEHWLSRDDLRRIALDPRHRDIGVGVASGAPEGSDENAVTVVADLGRPLTPELGRSVIAGPLSGVVRILRRGRFVRMTARDEVPVNSVFDTTQGVLRLQSAANAGGDLQQGVFSGGRFRVSQARTAGAYTQVTLTGPGFNRCRRIRPSVQSSQRRTTTRRRGRRVRRVFARARGRFRTRGRFASATVRGTNWFHADYCNGSEVGVTSGSVTVRPRRGRTRIVTRGRRVFFPR